MVKHPFSGDRQCTAQNFRSIKHQVSRNRIPKTKAVMRILPNGFFGIGDMAVTVHDRGLSKLKQKIVDDRMKILVERGPIPIEEPQQMAGEKKRKAKILSMKNCAAPRRANRNITGRNLP